MKVLSRIHSSAQAHWTRAFMGVQENSAVEASPADWYQMLRAYYFENGLYESTVITLFLSDIWKEALRPLRTPAYRVVEFYVKKLWPGMLPKALPLVTENQKIVDPIQQIWTWSNWGNRKSLAARWYANLGDMFIKVPVKRKGDTPTSVYLELIDPPFVTEFDVDERDFLTYVRIDIPRIRRKDGKPEAYTHTEVWDKEVGTFRVWEHTKSAEDSLGALGTPIREDSIDALTQDNFIPIVHAKFMDVGEKRGAGVFALHLDKIDEANRMATRLHQMMFRYNKPTMAVLANSVDAQNRPIPAPRIGSSGSSPTSGDTLDVHDDEVWRMPGMSKVEYLVPPLNYEQFRETINDMALELERDMPELAYYRLRDLAKGGQLSGKAAKTLLGDAVDQVLEVRGLAETALARAQAMALTIGQNVGLFKGLGKYESGDFEHSFGEREVIAESDFDKAETATKWQGAQVARDVTLKRAGWTDEEIKENQDATEKEREANQASFAQSLLEAERRRDQNNFQQQDNLPADQPTQ